jgi:hypothetical protein
LILCELVFIKNLYHLLSVGFDASVVRSAIIIVFSRKLSIILHLQIPFVEVFYFFSESGLLLLLEHVEDVIGLESLDEIFLPRERFNLGTDLFFVSDVLQVDFVYFVAKFYFFFSLRYHLRPFIESGVLEADFLRLILIFVLEVRGLHIFPCPKWIINLFLLRLKEIGWRLRINFRCHY